MQKERVILYVPLLGLLFLILILYAPPLFGVHTVLSDLPFMDKTTLLLTFAIASFAAVEGYSTFSRAQLEYRRHKIEDARNELEKAYGPLYTLLNKTTASSDEKTGFWLEFDERKKLDEIMATYPFMFSAQINVLWQEKIRKLDLLLDTSGSNRGGFKINLEAYVELRNLINQEYARKVQNYHQLLEK